MMNIIEEKLETQIGIPRKQTEGQKLSDNILSGSATPEREEKEIEGKKKKNKSEPYFHDQLLSLFPRIQSEPLGMVHVAWEGTHISLLALISHLSKFATISNNSPSFPSMYVKHLLSLDSSHTGVIRGMHDIQRQEVEGHLCQV